MVATSPERSDVAKSVAAFPFFLVGFVGAVLVHAAVWCGAAFMLGVDTARKRWARAG